MPTRCASICLLSIVALASGWPGSGLGQQAGRHPDARFVDRSLAPVATLRFAGPTERLPLRLAASPTATIGTEAGPDYQVFGAVTAVVFLTDTTVAILDRTVSAVRVFTTRGRYVGTIGRSGEGPGEFRNPVALAVSPTGELLVADLRRIIQVFVATPSGYRYARAIPARVGVRGMCFLGKTLFVNGISTSDQFVIRALDDSGRVFRSFGSIYQSPNSLVNYQVSVGHLACDAAAGLVLFMPTSLVGEVKAYRPDGTPVWRISIAGFRTNIMTDRPSGGMRVELSPQGVDRGMSLLSVPGVGILAQWAYNTRESIQAKEPATTIHTYVLASATGKGSLSRDSWPRLGAVRGSQAMAIFEDLAPRVELRALERLP